MVSKYATIATIVPVAFYFVGSSTTFQFDL